MKVLHVIPSLSFVHGGPSRAIRLVEQALHMFGIEVEILSTDDAGPGERNGKICGVPLKEEGGIRRYFPKRLEFYKVSPGLARWVKRHVSDYDLIHIHALFSFSSIVTAWAARSAGVPYVIRPVGTLNRYGVTKHRPLLKRLSLKFIEGPILRGAAAVHFTAEAERQEAEMLGIPIRSIVIPLGIGPMPAVETQAGEAHRASAFFAQYPQLESARILLYLSRLDPKKNVEGLLKAFSLLVKPDSSKMLSRPGDMVEGGGEQAIQGRQMLVIVGGGEASYVARLHKLSGELGLEEWVLWTGPLEGDLKAGAYAAASLFVLPSFSENFGIAAAEALSAGLPCVLGQGVAIASEVREAGAGLSVKPEPQEIASALQRLLADEGMRAEMGKRAARLAAERYSLKEMGRRLQDLYSKILSQRPPEKIE